MRRIAYVTLSLIFLLAVVVPGVLRAEETKQERYAREAALLPKFLGDSIYNLFKGHRFILTDIGHDLFAWSAIVEDSDGYRFYRGKSRSYIEVNPDTVHFWERTSEQVGQFDTALFMHDYRDLLKWALDTLPTVATVMRPKKKETWFWLRYFTEVVNQEGMPVFIRESNDSAYTGLFAHNNFNKKLSDLFQVMLWLKLGPENGALAYPGSPGMEKTKSKKRKSKH